MDSVQKTKVVFIAVYAAVAAVGACYLAAAVFFLLNKTIPQVIEIDTWYRYWQMYGSEGLQGGRLVKSAFAALAIVYVAPIIALVSSARPSRPLHGDARWANPAEIAKAGLL